MKKEIIKIILVAFVLTIILSTISLGKYFNKTKINVNSGVAIPIIKLEGEQKLIINNNQENKVYNLAVKNYDENEQITQVELEYYIEIISKKNDDINFKIYKEEKELVVFRDSFGSSIIPLLATGYSKITVIDTRYISPKLLKEYVTFENKDVLFMYSTLIINDSNTLK